MCKHKSWRRKKTFSVVYRKIRTRELSLDRHLEKVGCFRGRRFCYLIFSWFNKVIHDIGVQACSKVTVLSFHVSLALQAIFCRFQNRINI